MIQKLRSIVRWIIRKVQQNKRGFKVVLGIVSVAIVVIVALAMLASRGAGLIFNEVMARQTMLNGTVTVESIHATPWGRVSFTELNWTNAQGETILEVPSGSFRVNPWDVITKNFKASALRELTLEDAIIVVDMDDNMRLDFTKPSPDVKKPLNEVSQQPVPPKALTERKTTEQREADIEKRIRNFNWNGQHMDLKIYLENCQLEVFQKNRHYVMTDINTEIDLDSDKELKLDFSAGKFGGTAIGEGMKIKGTIDLRGVKHQELPTLNMQVHILGVDPASLGLGDNIHDPMTLHVDATGTLAHPVADGRVSMPELHIPALTFTQVIGDVHYDAGDLEFKSVSANVYNGTLEAHGQYNIDTRAYTFYGEASGLDSSIALKEDDFVVPVNVTMTFESKGARRDLRVWGEFNSDEGRYILIPIKSITGKFSNYQRHLAFEDVKIHLKYTTISTDALRIDDGELTMGALNITSNGGSNFIFHESDFDTIGDEFDNISNQGKAAQENSKRMSNDMKGLSEGIKRNKDDLDATKSGIDDVKDRFDAISERIGNIKFNK